MRPIDLFRPYISPRAADMVALTLAPDRQGRVYLGQGERVEEFERAFGELVGAPEPPLALNSCTSALELALYLSTRGPGGEFAPDYNHEWNIPWIITTPMTCTATNGAIIRSGARIIWADVDPITGLIDPDVVRHRVAEYGDEIAAIVAVDWGGRLCDYAALRANGLPVIQDAAHSILAGGPILVGGEPRYERTERVYGSGLTNLAYFCRRGDYACWSFQAIKHLTTGDGGALLCPRDHMERARLLRWYGLDRRSKADFRCEQDIQEVGWKAHMNDIAASIGLANLPEVPRLVAEHRANAAYYHEALAGAPGITLPPSDPGSSWWLYTILADGRDDLIRYLAERGIQASQVHARNDRHSGFRPHVVNPDEPLPGVDAFASRQVSIPVGWWLTESDRARVAEAVWDWAAKRRGMA